MKKRKNKKTESKSKPHTGPWILFLDIETAPLKSYHWGLWQQNIGLNQIIEEWTTLSWSVNWLHDPEDKVEFYSTGGRGVSRVRDDKPLLKKLWDYLDKADIVVAQNGKAFDIKKLNSRFLIHKFKPYSPVKVVDTKIISKSHFAHTSNRLEWLTQHLTKIKKLKHKKFPGFELWSECLNDNPEAWKEMEEYNKVDVIALRQLYIEVRPWTENHPNVATYHEMETVCCPKCGSDKVQKRGEAFTQTGRYHRFQCTGCGGWSRSRYTTNSPSKRKSLLAN